MRIRALTVVKDESDIIEQMLGAAVEWADEIHVLDNGSTDDTWERVVRFAEQDERVKPVGCDLAPFRDGIRAQLYNRIAAEAAEGDWWGRLDADEFYLDDPRAFLGAVPAVYGVVWMASLAYYFTDRDLERYESDPSGFGAEVPVTEKCRYYLSHWSEPRFFRHEKGMRWSERDGGFPPALSRRRVYGTRILQRHFPYRSPEQIQARLDARTRLGVAEFGHERIGGWAQQVADIRGGGHTAVATEQVTAPSWRDRVVSAASLDFDAHDGSFVVNEHLMPPIPERESLAGYTIRRASGLVRRAVPTPLKTLTRKVLS